MGGGVSYWLSEHPAIVGFRWGADQLWLATWPSLIVSLSLFAVLAVSLHFLLNLLGRSRPVPLGPIPALHSLAVAAVSAIIFVGTLLSTAAEIRDTRWSWRRLHMASPLHWLLCFPVRVNNHACMHACILFYYYRRLHCCCCCCLTRTRWDLNIGAILKLPLNFVINIIKNAYLNFFNIFFKKKY